MRSRTVNGDSVDGNGDTSTVFIVLIVVGGVGSGGGGGVGGWLKHNIYSLLIF